MDRNDIRNGMLVLFHHSTRVWKVIDRQPYDATGNRRKGGRYLRLQEWDHEKQECGPMLRHVKPADVRMFTAEREAEMLKADESAKMGAEKTRAEFNEVNAFFESIGLPGQVTLHEHSLQLTDERVPSYWSIRSYIPTDQEHPSGYTDPMRVVLCEFGVLEPVPTGDNE